MLQKRILISLFICFSVYQLHAQGPVVQNVNRASVFDTAAFESCHASTIVSLGKKQLLSAWFAGKQEGSPDVSIWGSFLRHERWTKPVLLANGIIADGVRYACWNPVLFQAKNGLLYLHYKIGPNPREWWAMYKVSKNKGKTWSAAIRMPEGFLGPIKNKPIQLASGKILYPSSTESKEGNVWSIHIEISDAVANHWRKVSIPADGFDVIQPSIVLHPDGRLQLLCRSRQNVIAQSWSDDEGESWSKITSAGIPNPNSGIDAVALQNGKQLLVYNPLPSGRQWWEGRAVLTIALSDNGINWKDIYTLEDHSSGEYSYPSVIQDAEGYIHITYTDKRKCIQYVALRLQ